MGLLDDAIREHLDLKRRRGADPAEVERLEREALGPVRRNREPADPDAAEPTGATDGGEDLAYDEPAGHDGGAPEPTAEDWPAHEPGGPDWSESGPAAPAAEAPAEDPDAPAGRRDAEPEWGYGHDPADPRFAADPPAARPLDEVENETAEYQIADQPAVDPDEDMLEETPEFLQDTPDHDRLWFEQRPPRDFDFDN